MGKRQHVPLRNVVERWQKRHVQFFNEPTEINERSLLKSEREIFSHVGADHWLTRQVRCGIDQSREYRKGEELYFSVVGAESLDNLRQILEDRGVTYDYPVPDIYQLFLHLAFENIPVFAPSPPNGLEQAFDDADFPIDVYSWDTNRLLVWDYTLDDALGWTVIDRDFLELLTEKGV